MNNINRIVADVKYNSRYTCATCGKVTIGETRHINLDVESAAALKNSIDNFRQTAHSMPVGWASCGWKFFCGIECLRVFKIQ